MSERYHLTVGGNPFCTWLGCAAGQDIAQSARVLTCSVVGEARAKADAAALAPFFKVEVAVVAGECPRLSDLGEVDAPNGPALIATAWALDPTTDDESIIASVTRWLDTQSAAVRASLAAHFEAEQKERTDEA